MNENTERPKRTKGFVNQFMVYNHILNLEFEELQQSLLSHPINQPITYSQMSPLSVVCSMPDLTFDDKDNNESLLEIIFKHCPDINQKDQMGKTPLHHAAKADNITAAKFLIECKY